MMKTSRKAAYWLVGVALGLMVMGATVPSPLYDVYRQQWGFSAGVLTLVFAAYALALIPTLLVFGSLSDEIGRRRVIITGLLTIAAGSLLFSLAQGLAWLFAARVVQGVAVGTMSGAATAALAELYPREDRRAATLLATAALAGGTATGPLFGALIAEYAPHPLVAPYLAHLGVSVLAACAIFAVMPETVKVGERSAWRPSRPRVPAEIRYPFVVGSAAGFCAWAAGGLFLALVPSYVASLLDTGNLVIGGGADAAMFGCACITQIALRRFPPRKAIVSGMAALILGLAAIVVAAPLHSIWLLLAGSLLTGAGLGLAFMGGLGLVGQVAPSESRAGTLSSCYVVSYLGLGLPTVGVGFAAVAMFAAVVSAICLLVALSTPEVRPS